jgi:4-aminobutyrate aminotransferase-like enzyme
MKSFVNFKKSKGNYFEDVDGNTILDLNAGAAGFALGYNADDGVNSRFSSVYDRFVTHKVNVNALPTHDMADLIRDNVMTSAPKSGAHVHLGGGSTGTEANELAVAVAMKHYAKAHGVDSMSKLCVVGFNNSNHG